MSVDNVNEVAAAGVGAGASLMSLLPMVLIFVIFYFFLIRPQLKKQKQVEKMVSELKKGDQVVAAGGIFGTIHKIEDNIAIVEIGENNRIKVLKSSITEVSSKETAATQEKTTTEAPKAAKPVKPAATKPKATTKKSK